MAEHVADYNRHRIVATCIIFRRDPDHIRYLIHKRRPDINQYPNLWTVVGGGLDRSDYEVLPKTSPDGWDNPIEIALQNEVKQEAGVEVGSFEYINNFSFIRFDGVPVFGMRFYAEYLSGEAIFDEAEATECAWITAEETDKYRFLGNVAQEILDLDERLNVQI